MGSGSTMWRTAEEGTTSVTRTSSSPSPMCPCLFQGWVVLQELVTIITKIANKRILLAHFSIFKELFLLHLVQVMQLHLQHYKVNCNNHWKKLTTNIFHFFEAKTIDAGCPPRLCGRASCSSIRGLATCFLPTSRLRLHDVVSNMMLITRLVVFGYALISWLVLYQV